MGWSNPANQTSRVGRCAATGKVGYRARRDAEKQARRLVAKGDDVHAFFCKCCGKHHVGSWPRWMPRKAD